MFFSVWVPLKWCLGLIQYLLAVCSQQHFLPDRPRQSGRPLLCRHHLRHLEKVVTLAAVQHSPRMPVTLAAEQKNLQDCL